MLSLALEGTKTGRANREIRFRSGDWLSLLLVSVGERNLLARLGDQDQRPRALEVGCGRTRHRKAQIRRLAFFAHAMESRNFASANLQKFRFAAVFSQPRRATNRNCKKYLTL